MKFLILSKMIKCCCGQREEESEQYEHYEQNEQNYDIKY